VPALYIFGTDWYLDLDKGTFCSVRELQCMNNLETYAGDSMVADGNTDARQI
jgi:hypothetical protein